MAESGEIDRLQPSLLDRLTDLDPTRQKETREQRVIDIRRLREIVQRDLAWLLNTTNSEQIIDPERYPNVASSTVNYGVAEVAGDYSTEGRAERIRLAIRRGIERFEPRLRPGSVDVELRMEDVNRETTIFFDIRADLWAEPVPMELYLRSEVDITTGTVSFERLA